MNLEYGCRLTTIEQWFSRCSGKTLFLEIRRRRLIIVWHRGSSPTSNIKVCTYPRDSPMLSVLSNEFSGAAYSIQE
jgi:hypothetical protein